VVHYGKVTARIRPRGQLLLKMAEGWSVQELCKAFDVSIATVYNTHTRYQQGGVEAVQHDRVPARRRQALTGDEEALLVAIPCSPVPEGQDHWTLRLLRNKRIELGVVERIAPATIHAVLKKTISNRGGRNRGV